MNHLTLFLCNSQIACAKWFNFLLFFVNQTTQNALERFVCNCMCVCGRTKASMKRYWSRSNTTFTFDHFGDFIEPNQDKLHQTEWDVWSERIKTVLRVKAFHFVFVLNKKKSHAQSKQLRLCQSSLECVPPPGPVWSASITHTHCPIDACSVQIETTVWNNIFFVSVLLFLFGVWFNKFVEQFRLQWWCCVRCWCLNKMAIIT